ncbi:MAG: type VI secretion system baseplate subunit TssE [Planctomycetes bacterium]|nr:type VI secretion system baseplate subunit TssE [Planctomycetota bacterium]
MAREQTLLERIASCERRLRDRLQPTTNEDIDALMESVRFHLARLLNARHGMSEAMPDYGLPALTDLVVGSGTYIEAVEEAIRVTIDKYEPRLRRVRVTRIQDDEGMGRMLAFRVDAVLISQSGEHKVWYETEVTGAGDFDVTD